jgi:hypothetical protein
MAPASVVGVVYPGAVGTAVVGLVTRPDRGDRGPIGGRYAPAPRLDHRFLGSNAKAGAGTHQTRPSALASLAVNLTTCNP